MEWCIVTLFQFSPQVLYSMAHILLTFSSLKNRENRDITTKTNFTRLLENNASAFCFKRSPYALFYFSLAFPGPYDDSKAQRALTPCLKKFTIGYTRKTWSLRMYQHLGHWHVSCPEQITFWRFWYLLLVGQIFLASCKQFFKTLLACQNIRQTELKYRT